MIADLDFGVRHIIGRGHKTIPPWSMLVVASFEELKDATNQVHVASYVISVSKAVPPLSDIIPLQKQSQQLETQVGLLTTQYAIIAVAYKGARRLVGAGLNWIQQEHPAPRAGARLDLRTKSEETSQ